MKDYLITKGFIYNNLTQGYYLNDFKLSEDNNIFTYEEIVIKSIKQLESLYFGIYNKEL